MERPTKQEISAMPLFIGMPIEHICIVDNPCSLELAQKALAGVKLLGFDTESKPTFATGEKSTGPHLIQFANADQAFLIPVKYEAGLKLALDIAADSSVLKVGFGVAGDKALFRRRFDAPLNHVQDLSKTLKTAFQLPQAVGARAAIAILYGHRLSKSSQRSNWAQWPLSESQIHYAANDAFAAFAAYQQVFGGDDSQNMAPD